MKKLIKSRMLFIFGTLLWVSSSCQKDGSLLDNGSVNAAPGGLDKIAQLQEVSEDLSALLDAYYENSTNVSKTSGDNSTSIINGCGSVTLDTISMPHVLTLDFGPTNCQGPDGVNRRGKLIATFTGPYSKPGTVTTYATEDFYQADNRIDGSRTISNLGYVNGQIHFLITDNITMTLADNQGTITQQAEINRAWVEGEGTSTKGDDVYLLSGFHNTSFSTGEQYLSETSQSLRKENSYRYITSGVVKVERPDNNQLNFMMDYGYPNGGRDNEALVTYRDGSTKVVQLQ